MDIYDKIMRIYKRWLVKCRRKHKAASTFFKSSTTKRMVTSCCSLTLSAETEAKKKALHEKLKVLVKKYINTPEKLIQYLKVQGVVIHKIPFAEKILSWIGEEEGFIIPLKGIKAMALNFFVGLLSEKRIKISAKTTPLMVFDNKGVEIYTIARAAYKYYGFKNEMPGYDYQSQTVFKKVYNKRKNSVSPFATCSIQDMYACKEAIARDIESINFTIELSVEYENAKKALKKMKEQSANI